MFGKEEVVQPGALIVFRLFRPIGDVSKLNTLSQYMGVSENSGTPKSSILIGFSIINHPFWGTPIFGNPHMICIDGIFVHHSQKACRRSGSFAAAERMHRTECK